VSPLHRCHGDRLDHFLVVARHTAERYSYSKIFIAMAWLADIVGLPTGIGGLATTLLMELPHSRKQEYEGTCLFVAICSRRRWVEEEDVRGREGEGQLFVFMLNKIGACARCDSRSLVC
jgi:hypothetical protein